MPQRPYPASRLALLLFPEVCLLGALAGILAERYPGPGLTLLALVWLLDLPRTRSLSRSLCFVLSFCCAFAYSTWSAPRPQPVPDWLCAAVAVRGGAEEAASSQALRVHARVLRADLLQGNRARVILTDIAPVQGENELASYKGRVVWNWRAPDFLPLPGERLELVLRFSQVRGLANPGVWNTEDYWHDRGVWFRAWSSRKAGVLTVGEGGFWQSLRRSLRERFYANLPRPGGADGKKGEEAQLTAGAGILPALLFADRSQISHRQHELFARATLAHSLALSGMHLGFALLCGLALAFALGRICPRLWLHMDRPRLAVLLSLPVALFYLWLGQMPLSLLRAACMLAFGALLLFLKRQRVLLDSLFAALAVILICNPQALFDISLQLSALSVAAIALSLPGISCLAARLFPAGRQRGIPGRLLRGAFVLAGTSCVLQIVLLPLNLGIFGASGLLFPLNLLWLPMLGAVVLPLSFAGLFCASLGLDAFASALLYLASAPCEGLLYLLSFLDAAFLLPAPLLPRPHWLMTAGYWLICLNLPGCLRRLISGRSQGGPGMRAGGLAAEFAFVLCAALMLALPIVWQLQKDSLSGVRLRVLDVGQGQSILLEWTGLGKERKAGRVLVDGGGFPGEAFDTGHFVLAPVLTDMALPRLDAVIASHPDADHLSGLLFILKNFAVGQYYGNGGQAPPLLAAREHEALARTGLGKKQLQAGDSLDLAPELRLDVLWPPPGMQKEPMQEEGGNKASLILRLVWQGFSLALLCGDAQAEALQGLMAAQGAGLAAELLVLPHHGSAASLSPAFYRAVRPSIALASCGYGNRWGFPSAAVLSALREQGVPVRDTAQFGQIDLRWRKAGEKAKVTYAKTGESGSVSERHE